MKITYFITVSTLLALTEGAALKLPRKLVTGSVFSLTCNGTSGAECSKAWWTLCSVEGNIVMPAPVTWKHGDCTDVQCSCVNPSAEPVITPAVPAPSLSIQTAPNQAAPTATGYPVLLEDLHHLKTSSKPFQRTTTTTTTFPRPHATGQPHPEVVTVVPASDATPLAGSYIWK